MIRFLLKNAKTAFRKTKMKIKHRNKFLFYPQYLQNIYISCCAEKLCRKAIREASSALWSCFMASIHLLYLSSLNQVSFCYLLSFPFSLFFSCWSFCSRCCFSSSCSCRCCSSFLWCSRSSCWCFIASISCCCCGEGTREKQQINTVRPPGARAELPISWH